MHVRTWVNIPHRQQYGVWLEKANGRIATCTELNVKSLYQGRVSILKAVKEELAFAVLYL